MSKLQHNGPFGHHSTGVVNIGRWKPRTGQGIPTGVHFANIGPEANRKVPSGKGEGADTRGLVCKGELACRVRE